MAGRELLGLARSRPGAGKDPRQGGAPVLAEHVGREQLGVDAGRVETDRQARLELYRRAATIIADEVSYIYLYNPAVLQAWVPEVEGYEARGDAAIRFRDTSLNQ